MTEQVPPLTRAIELIKSGNKREARKMLMKIVQAEPGNEKAWLWMAETMADETGRISILKRYLNINPTSKTVIKALHALEKQQVKVSSSPKQKNDIPTSPIRVRPAMKPAATLEETSKIVIYPRPVAVEDDLSNRPAPAQEEENEPEILIAPEIEPSVPSEVANAPIPVLSEEAIETPAAIPDRSQEEAPGSSSVEAVLPSTEDIIEPVVDISEISAPPALEEENPPALEAQPSEKEDTSFVQQELTVTPPENILPASERLQEKPDVPSEDRSITGVYPIQTPEFFAPPSLEESIRPVPLKKGKRARWLWVLLPALVLGVLIFYSLWKYPQLLPLGFFSPSSTPTLSPTAENTITPSPQPSPTLTVTLAAPTHQDTLTPPAIDSASLMPLTSANFTAAIHLADFSPLSQALAISSDGHWLAMGEENLVNIWDLNNGEKIYSLDGHIEKISAVFFSPDNMTLASTSPDFAIKLWNLKNGELLNTFQFKLEDIQAIYQDDPQIFPNRVSVAISADGTRLAAGAFGLFTLWNLESGERLANIEVNYQSLKDEYSDGMTGFRAVFSPDSSRLAVFMSKHSFLINAQNGKILTGLHGELAVNAAFSPDSQYLVQAFDGSYQLLNSKDGTKVQDFAGLSSATQTPAGFGFSPSGNLFLYQPSSEEGSGMLILWDLQNKQAALQLVDFEGYLLKSSFSPDSRLLAVGSESEGAPFSIVYDVESGRIIQRFENASEIIFLPDGNRFFIPGSQFISLYGIYGE